MMCCILRSLSLLYFVYLSDSLTKQVLQSSGLGVAKETELSFPKHVVNYS